MIFCSQYHTDEWYGRLDPASAKGARFPKRSWTGSSTTLMTFLLMATSPCENAMGSRHPERMVMANDPG